MQNEDEAIQLILDKHSTDTILQEAYKDLEYAKKRYLILKRELIAWQAACVRAQLAIRCIKYKDKKNPKVKEFIKWDF